MRRDFTNAKKKQMSQWHHQTQQKPKCQFKVLPHPPPPLPGRMALHSPTWAV